MQGTKRLINAQPQPILPSRSSPIGEYQVTVAQKTMVVYIRHARLRALVFLATLLLGGAAAAQERYTNSCAPELRGDCDLLVFPYSSGGILKPFPDDLPRAQALVRMAIDGALAKCGQARSDHCYVLSDLALYPGPDADPDRYSPEARMGAYLQQTEAGCDAGYSSACYWRGNASGPETFDVLLRMKMAEGLSRADAAGVLQADERHFRRRARTVAITEAALLRGECAAGSTTSCGTLGMVLRERSLPGDTPFEAVRLLTTYCSADDPQVCLSAQFALGKFAISQGAPHPEFFNRLSALDTGGAAGNTGHCDLLTRLASQRGAAEWGLDEVARADIGCEMGSGYGCMRLGGLAYRAYSESDEAEDLARATHFLDLGCRNGDNFACHKLEHISGI